ncbi:MAG: TRAP transporter large permease [Burkholderiales bacterium]|nr:TRAP transporter large permease [Burkholderiales bacterium]
MIAVAFLIALFVISAIAVLTSGGSVAQLPLGPMALLIGLFLLFFGAGIYIAAALGILGIIAGFAFSNRPFWDFIGQMVWGPTTNFVLVAVPLFLLMGEIMLRAGLSDQLYRSLNLWFQRVPGGLLHTNIASSSVFSAISGSSVATAATMGAVALPYFRKTAYAPPMVLGSLAAGGALGNLIPPGITFIVYGLITETSVGQLYVAAVGPSLLVVLLFTAVIFAHGLRHPLPRPPKIPLAAKLKGLAGLIPTAILIFIVLGTIYTGLATPTESAALGVTAAIAFSLFSGRFSWRMLDESAKATAHTTAFVGLILCGAYVLNFIFGALGVPQAMAQFVASLPVPPWVIMALIIGFYLALGTFMEGFSMIVTTIPVIFPLVKALGYDPVWFGVVVTMLVEIALISPPDGTVLYVLQGMRGQPGPITDVFKGVLPFIGAYVLAVVILMIVPELALWLPRVAR